MKVVIFGATGMVGKGVLLECLDDARVEHVMLVSRHPTDVTHPKIREIMHADFTDFGSIKATYGLTLAAATALASASADRLTFCYVSGEGTDSAERGRTMWARVKGKAAAFMFRPGYIQPLRGIRSKTRWYQALYDLTGPLYPILRRMFPRYVTTTVNNGRAMIHVAASGSSKQILSSADINQLSV
jgi:hypothetical protein